MSRSPARPAQSASKYVTVEEMTEASFRGVDIALFSAGGDISRAFRPAVVSAGAVMIDNSSAFRMDKDVPLVVPEVNPEDIKWNKGVIANPNCTTAIMLVAVAPLHRAKKLRRLVAATYQAASGAGAKGMEELILQTRQVLDNQPIAPRAFVHRIAFNLIPHIDSFQENGYTKEELKMVNESRKMLHLPELKVSCTCVRIPALRAHSEALNLEFESGVRGGDHAGRGAGDPPPLPGGSAGRRSAEQGLSDAGRRDREVRRARRAYPAGHFAR